MKTLNLNTTGSLFQTMAQKVRRMYVHYLHILSTVRVKSAAWKDSEDSRFRVQFSHGLGSLIYSHDSHTMAYHGLDFNTGIA